MQIMLKSLFLLSAIGITTNSMSAEQCPTNDNKVIFINGIQNTLNAANESAKKLASILSASQNRTDQAKRKFDVTPIWNPIGFTGKGKILTTLPQDLRELMVEKTSEELFADNFKKVLSPHNSLKAIDKAAAQRVKKHLDNMTPGVTSIESAGEITDANLVATQDVVKSLVEQFNANKRVIVVAHSQGNLLANLAWASYASDVTTDPNQNVRIVNVGNTSQFSVNGLNISHANDAALGSLIQLPKTKSWKRTTPNCSGDLCEFQLASPTFKGAEGKDFLNHGFTETYLSSLPLPDAIDTQGVTFTAGKTSFVDRFEDMVYAASASLDHVQGFSTNINACIKVDSISCTKEIVQNGTPDGEQVTHWKVKGYAITPENRTFNVSLSAGPNMLVSAIYHQLAGLKGFQCTSWDFGTPPLFSAFNCLGQRNFPSSTEFTTDIFGDAKADGFYFNLKNHYTGQNLNGQATDFTIKDLSCPGSYTYK